MLVSGVPLTLALYGFHKLANGRKLPARMLLAGFGVTSFFAVVADNLYSLLMAPSIFKPLAHSLKTAVSY